MEGTAFRDRSKWGMALLLAPLGFLACNAARAAEPCGIATPPATTWGQRVAAVACAEHRLWYSPFLDENGRLASIGISEAENSRLNDGTTPAWRRVVDYWKGTGLLYGMSGRPGASECGAGLATWPGSAACRAFVVDTPWSAVFVSFAYVRAGVPGFAPSASHFDFMRQALRDGPDSSLRFANPDTDVPAVGDMLCFTRGQSTPIGTAGIRSLVARNSDNIAMHCDIVVAIDNGKLYAVGGNVLQGVTMRTLHVNRNGTLWNLPHKSGTPALCTPGVPAGCTFNRQDWVALIKLEPKTTPPAPVQNCCTLCPLPMPPDMKRCPAPTTPLNPQAPQTPVQQMPASPSTTATPPATP
jgi:hypothetical protein